MVYLAQTAQRRHDAEAVRSLRGLIKAKAATASEVAGIAQLQAWVTACLVWLAWQDRRLADVITLSDELAELMAATVGSGFSRGLVYLWPLIAVHLDTGNVAGAVAAGRQLLQPGRLPLPDDLESAVDAASRAWDQGQPELSRDRLAAALALARDLRYF